MNIKLFRSCSVIITCFLLFTGCSAYMAQSKQDKRKQIYQKLNVGISRSEIVNTLGEPYKKDGNFIDFYEICIPPDTPKDASFHVVMDIMTIGIWELFAVPLEATTKNCRKEKIVLVFDKHESVSAIYSEPNFKKLESLFETTLKAAEELKADDSYFLLNYDPRNGWSFIDKKHVACSFKGNLIKGYVKRVMSFKDCLDYKSTYKLDSIPLIHYSTFIVNIENNQFKQMSVNLYNENGEVVYMLPNTDWREMYPDTYSFIIGNLLLTFCNNELKEYEEKEKPQMKDFLKGV